MVWYCRTPRLAVWPQGSHNSTQQTLLIASQGSFFFLFEFADKQLAFERNQRHILNPWVISYPMMPLWFTPTLPFFPIVPSIVSGWCWHKKLTWALIWVTCTFGLSIFNPQLLWDDTFCWISGQSRSSEFSFQASDGLVCCRCMDM
jgi:hypothetical protein